MVSSILQHRRINMKNQKAKSKNVLFCICIFTLLSLLFNIGEVNAEGASIGINPAILQIEALPPSDVRAPFTIENLGEEPVELKIGYRLFKAADKESGQIAFLTDKDPFPGADKNIFDKIQVIDDNLSIDSIELGPKQKKKLLLRIIVPKDEAYSDYYFSLIFLTEAENTHTDGDEESTDSSQNSFSTSQAGLAMNVLLSVGPKENDKGYIEDFSGPFYVESGPYNFSLQVKNAGSHYITPRGTILINNMFGQTIGKVEVAPDNILAGTSRYLNDSKFIDSALDTDTSHVTWREKFLLGFYNAKLSITMSDNGPVYNRTIHFIAFPAKLLLGIVITILILLFAYLRIRKGISTE
jgi:hypothetical protein